MTTSFFLIFSEHPWDKLHTNLPHLQFLANNCAYSSHTDIKLCTCLYRHTTVLIHEILYLANQHCCSDFLTPPTPLIIPHRLPAFLESLMPLKNWCSIHGLSSHKMYSNNILNFQASATILNACPKISGNLLNSLRIYIYIYIWDKTGNKSDSIKCTTNYLIFII